MALFEVQRLIAAWPSLRNIQWLRKLCEEPDDCVRVCVIPGHVVIGSSRQASFSGGYLIHIFDQVPSSALQSDPSDPVVSSSPLVDVVMFTDSIIGMICSSGIVHVMEYHRLTYQWEVKGSLHLNLGDGDGQLCKSVINGCGHLVYLVRHNNISTEWSYSVYVNTLLPGVNNSYQSYENTLLLTHCPPMEFFVVSNGVWIFAEGSVLSPPDVMMFLRNNGKDLEGYSFQYTGSRKSTFQCEDPICTQDFRILCRKIAWKLKKATPSTVSGNREYIVSVCVHTLCQDLLVLLSDGRIYQLRWDKDTGIQYTFIVKLNAFTERYPMPKPWFTTMIPESATPKSPYTMLQLFLCYTYIGVFLHGELRLYDSATGEFVWECDDLDHTSTRMINNYFPTSPVPFPVVLLNQSGIHFLRCKRIVDHANMYVDSLFPISTNADETTPGDFLKDGELYAAYVCDLWGLTVLAAHYTTTLAYQILKKNTVAPPVIQPELLNQLEKLFNQSPSLCVALMAQYPASHDFLLHCLSNCNIEKDMPTALESEAVPLLKRYLELSQDLERLMNAPVQSIDSNLPVKTRTIEILQISQQYTASTDPTADLRTELFVLSTCNPSEVLLGMKEFMNVKETFFESLKTGSCSPDINWRNLFACELAEKASLTSQKASVQVTRLPVFETVCNLLYQLDPNDLKHFVVFAHMVREGQQGEASFIRRTIKKEYFYQRAVEAIPQPDDKSTVDQIQAFSELCLLSDCANVELEALSVLLKSSMWEKVIAVLKGIKPEVPTHLNSALFHRSMLRFSSGGVLHLFLGQLWELLPKTFSILDFIEVLKTLKHEEDGILATTKQLSVAEISPYILHLLAQENDHKQQDKQ